MLRELRQHPRENWSLLNLSFRKSIPEGRSIADVVEVLEETLSCYEALRTLIVDDGDPVQVVLRSGSVPLRVYTRPVEGSSPENSAGVPKKFAEAPFDFSVDLPVRFGLVVRDGRPLYLLVALSHMAIDVWGQQLLEDSISNRLRGVSVPRPDFQPVDQRRWEDENPRSAALDYVRSQWKTAPQTMFPVPRTRTERLRFSFYRMESRAVTAALRCLVSRTRTSSTAVLLAAMSSVLAWHSGLDLCHVQFTVSNRVRPAMRSLVGPCSQNVPLVLDTSAPRFAELVSVTFRQIIKALSHGVHSPSDAVRVRQAVEAERGVCILPSFRFNDTRKATHLGRASTGDGLHALLSSTTVQPLGIEEPWDAGPTLHAVISDSGDATVVTTCFDAQFMDKTWMAEFLRGVERLLVCAMDSTMTFERAQAAVGVLPPRGDSDLVLVDACLVDLRAVHDLVAEVCQGSSVRIFLERSADGRGRIVAFISGDGRVGEPADIHERCVARLCGYPAAMAPHWYYVLAATPDRPEKPDSWYEGTILAHASGRG